MPLFGLFGKKESPIPPLDQLEFEDGCIHLVPTGYRPSRADLERLNRNPRNSEHIEGPRAGIYNYKAAPYDPEYVLRRHQERHLEPLQQQSGSRQHWHGSNRSGTGGGSSNVRGTRIGRTQRTMHGYQTDAPQFFGQRSGSGGAGMPGMNPSAFSGGSHESRRAQGSGSRTQFGPGSAHGSQGQGSSHSRHSHRR